MQRISRHIRAITGTGLPLPGDDIDTDQIIESRYLKRLSFQGMETCLFESQRRLAARDPEHPHPLDDPRFQGATLLLVNRNFGCGSSREHAPQALYRFGFRAIVGASFGEIFADNCLSIGLACVSVAPDDALWLQGHCARHPATRLHIDLADAVLHVDERRLPVHLPEGRRQRLLQGRWNSLDLLMDNLEAARARIATLPPLGAP